MACPPHPSLLPTVAPQLFASLEALGFSAFLAALEHALKWSTVALSSMCCWRQTGRREGTHCRLSDYF